LLHALVEIGEREDRQLVSGRERLREAQIDERGKLLARAAAAERDEAIEHLAGALLRVAHDWLQLLAGVELGERREDERMARHGLVEGLVETAGPFIVALARQESAIGVDQPQHGAVGAHDRFEALLGLGLVAEKIRDQRGVIVAQRREAFAAQLIQRLEGAALLLLAGVAPGVE